MLGICNYDKSIADAFTFPAGIDKETAIDRIILSCGEYELYYPNADFLKLAIANFCKTYYRTFEKWVNALSIEYNPLENYDRQEDYTDTTNRSGTNANNTTTSNTSTDNATNKRSSFDTSQLVATDGTDATTSNSSTGASNGTMTDNATVVHTARLHGNIGVTTSQQMLQSELDIAKWSIYEHIATLFSSEFVIAVL